MPPPSFPENHVANFPEFRAQKALFKGSKSATIVFGLSPHPFKLLRKFICFVGATRPLTRMARPAKLPLQQQITTKVIIQNI